MKMRLGRMVYDVVGKAFDDSDDQFLQAAQPDGTQGAFPSAHHVAVEINGA